MNQIQEFSDEDLVQELMARYDDIVIGARRVLDASQSKAQRRRWWKGDMDACIGLCNGVCNDLVGKIWGISSDDVKYD